MKPVRIIILAVAVLSAAMAGLLAMKLTRAPAPQMAEPVIERAPTVNVLVASKSLPVGSRLGGDSIQWMAWPKDGVVDGLITDENQPSAIDDLTGAVVRLPIFNGEPVPLYTVTPTQINFVAPMKAPTTGTGELQVMQVSTGRIYAAATVPMVPVSPAIMMQTYENRNRQAAVINLQDGTVNSSTNPAKRGSYVQIYATGQGFVQALADRDGESVGQACFGNNIRQIDSQMHDRLGDLRPDPADNTLGTHETRRGHGLQEMLGDQRINGRHAGNVDNRYQ